MTTVNGTAQRCNKFQVSSLFAFTSKVLSQTYFKNGTEDVIQVREPSQITFAFRVE